MINAAIVGLGRWGQNLVDSVQGSSSNISFVAGITRTKSNAVDYCKKNNIDLRDTYEEVIGDSNIDAVVLATPHSQHADQIMKAASFGKHVFSEKPFTLDAKSAQAAVDACMKAGVVVALGHNRRFMENIIALKALVESGELGTLLHIDGNQSSDLSGTALTWRDSRNESPAGGMTSLGIHALDCMIHMGGRIEEVDCYSTRRAIPCDIDDATASVIRFERGMTGTLVSLASSPRIWQLRVVGTGGWAEATDNKTLAICRGGEIETQFFTDSPYPHMPSIAGELEAFAMAALGQAPYPITPAEMVHGSAVLEAIIKSASLGKRVRPQG